MAAIMKELAVLRDKFDRSLTPVVKQAKLDLGDDETVFPVINLGVPISMLADALGRLLRNEHIFRLGELIVTVDPESGTYEPMTPNCFCSWVERFVRIVKSGRDGDVICSMSAQIAVKILESHDFKRKLRPLNGINDVQLPVRRADGRVEMLVNGYDEETGYFTASKLNYPVDWTCDAAREFLANELAGYSFDDPETETPVPAKRSASVVVALLLGSYCRLLFPPGTLRPMGVFTGNKAGTGKSTLVNMVLGHVHEEPSNTDLPPSREEMTKVLSAVAMEMSPYVWFDDVGFSVFNTSLNRFVTSRAHAGRVLGESRTFKVPQMTQVFVTGHALKLSHDLLRRSLVCELFLESEITHRRFSRIIDGDYLRRPVTRANYLAACHAILRHWLDQQEPPHPHPKESFEQWSTVVGGMILAAGFCDPLQRPDLAQGGDEEDAEFKMLFRDLAGRVCDGAVEEYTRSELVTRARQLQILEDLVGDEETGDLKKADLIKLGLRLKRYHGLYFRDRDDRVCQFAKRKVEHGKIYPVHVLTSEEAAAVRDLPPSISVPQRVYEVPNTDDDSTLDTPF